MLRITRLLAVLLVAWGGFVQAQTLSEATYRRLTKIHELIGEEAYGEALDKLEKLLPATKYSPYETAMVYQTYGFIYAQQGDYRKAADYFRQAIGLNALPEMQVESMKYNLGQFQVAVEDYRDGIKTLEEYFATAKNPIPLEARVLLATAYAQLKQYRKALPHLSRAIQESKEPKEMWYQLKLALHYELDDYRSCATTLLDMVGLFPLKEQYWKQLSGMFMEIKKDKDALAILALADRRGYLDDSKEIINLGNLYLYLDIPFKAAQVLDDGLRGGIVEGNEKNYEMLSNAWIGARETDKAISALAKAAERTDDGELVLRLAYLYVQQEAWAKVLPTLDRARTLGVKKPGEAAMLQGIAAAELGRFDEALKAFGAARKFEDTREEASAWLQHALTLQAEQGDGES
ncbi:MAG: tetratricopeptide repeat protein [Oceanococcaceae bacterium]